MTDATGPVPDPASAEGAGADASASAADKPNPRRETAPGRAEQSEPVTDFHAQVRAARSDIENQVQHAMAEFEQANERIKERTGRDLILAILIGVGIGAILVLSLIFLSWPFVVFALAAALLGIFEFGRALSAAGHRVDLVPQLISGTVLVVSGYFLDPWMLWVVAFVAVTFVVVWRLIAQMARRDGRSYGAVLTDVLVAAFMQLYVPFLTSLCVVLLTLPRGEWWVLAFIIVAVSADTGAYAIGLSLGKHPMAPRISPKKTWEGFAGAAAASIIAAILLALFMLGLPWWTGLVIGPVLLLSATAGDLGESMIKRDLGIKDMSSWLPGHGGVLDRLDSILPSAPVALGLAYLFIPLAGS
ncbi:phosphatidate cytidylyltransferase [Microbacterium sp. BWT-B31]|uniref:phosphatidate cytidylyltransferase n=1 Tax=Microbacterium sp. BWT-B31 TaxID=3232072 RepID=UPI00352909D0